MINATSLLTMFRAAFNRAMSQLKDLFSPKGNAFLKLVFQDTTTEGEAAYNWLLAFPIVRKFLGTKTYNELSEEEYKLKVDAFYTGLRIKEEDLRRRKLPNVGVIQMSNARALALHKKKMIAQALIDGTTALAYDGIPFFSGITGKRKIDNLIAGTGTSVTQIQADLSSARQTGMKFFFSEDPNEEAIGIVHSIVVCGPALEETFKTIKNSTANPNGANSGVANIHGSYIDDIIVMPWTDDENDWYLISLSIMEPLILLSEKLDGQDIRHMVDDTKLKSDHVLLYSAESNLKIGYTFPQLAMKIVNT